MDRGSAVIVSRTELSSRHVVMMIIEDHQFHAMCRVIEREDMIDDPKCVDLITRFMNAEALFAELETEIVKWTTQELVERARKFGAPLAPANGIPEMISTSSILTLFDRLDRELLKDRKAKHSRRQYEFLSEFAHPNWAGSVGLFAELNQDDFAYEFGIDLAKRDRLATTMIAGIGSIRIIENCVNKCAKLLPAIAELSEQDAGEN